MSLNIFFFGPMNCACGQRVVSTNSQIRDKACVDDGSQMNLNPFGVVCAGERGMWRGGAKDIATRRVKWCLEGVMVYVVASCLW